MKTSQIILSDILLWLKSLAGLFIKRECICCKRELLASENSICIFCAEDLPLTYCWINAASPADRTFWGRSKIERVIPLITYSGIYKAMLYSIKYHGNARMAIRLGRLLGSHLLCLDIDLVIPVPLHPRKKRQRGYNQSELIAKGITDRLKSANKNIRVENRLLLRKNFTPTQTRKDRADRWQNVKNAFCINAKCVSSLKAKTFRNNCNRTEEFHFLLVDDVLTTGATLDACASILLAEFNCRVSIATLAYTP